MTRGNGVRLSTGKSAGLPAGLLLVLLVFSSSVRAKAPFEYRDVVEKARLLAQKPYTEPESLPEFLTKMDSNQWHDIRFKPGAALWAGDKLPFRVEFFFPGWVFNHIEKIDVVESGKATPVRFSPKLFNYGMNKFDSEALKGLGFAGFRLCYPMDSPNSFTRFAVYLGASYFRVIGKNERFGLSARGAAIDTALPSGEEYPYFREFWLVRPPQRATSITLFALLDSRSLTGAYLFVIEPGETTSMYVTATLFLRNEVKKLGIAPLTSMFFYGENTNLRPVDNFRPEVHDSDGLQIANATGEWIWRPLLDPGRLLVTSFQLDNPEGFGLFQRDTDFAHYQDLENNYQMRPSAWVIPKKGWGKGRLELVEIPTDSENNDNIVAYWVPSAVFKPGAPIDFSYQIKWGLAGVAEPPFGRVIATRTSVGTKSDVKTYRIDFEGGKLSALPAGSKLEADLSADGGKIVEQHIRKNPFTGGWRLVFRVQRTESGRPLELRAFLREKDEILTETWSYVDPFTEAGCR